MKKVVLPLLTVGSLLLTACNMQTLPAPAAPMVLQVAATEAVENMPTTATVAAADLATTAEPVAETSPAAGNVLTADVLKTATYSGIYDEPVTLTDGHWEGEPYEEGGASRPTVDYMEGSALFGDLDGDGVEDAVVFLVESGGGSGSFVYVAAQLNRDGQAVDAGGVLIEDRIQIESAAIDAGQVLVEAIVPGPGDGACCASHKANKVYDLQDGKLIEVTPEGGDLVKLSAADLDGTAWTLTELAEGQPVLEDTEITIHFDDGAISGSAGCNTYTSAYSLSEDNPFLITLEPVTATRMVCDDPVMDQETAYLSALETVSIWGYRFGDLVLRYAAVDGTPGLLIFAPVHPEHMGDGGHGTDRG